MDVLKGKSDKAKEKNSKLEDTALRKVPRMQLRDQGGPCHWAWWPCGTFPLMLIADDPSFARNRGSEIQ